MVIATTFLSIIGISAGILLANERDRREALNPPVPPVVTTQPPPVVESPTLDGEPCRQETLDAASAAGYLPRLKLLRPSSSFVRATMSREPVCLACSRACWMATDSLA